MRVFMLGWEFPPFISGGLGTACHGLTKALSIMGIDITFVLPTPLQPGQSTHVKMLTPATLKGLNLKSKQEIDAFKRMKILGISSPLTTPYSTPQDYQKKIEDIIRQNRDIKWLEEFDDENQFRTQNAGYGGDMFTETKRYAAAAVKLAIQEDFDVIHAHDWMTYPAAIAVAQVTAKPLVTHIHSTEFDRSGENVNQPIYDIERRGMHAADRVIAVSHLTRNIVITRYAVEGEKVEVIYNGVEQNGNLMVPKEGIKKNEKIVLFLGRITMQKGPEYFLLAAKKVLKIMDNVKFVIAGSGDMMKKIIEMAAEMGIGNKVLFTGFLRGKDVERIYKLADLYVMPSVSEPFGIAPLEALNHDVPVLISKQSGVAEVLSHVLKVDFWDIDEMANKITAVLKYQSLQMTLKEHGNFEVRKLRWDDAAANCIRVYSELTSGKLASV